MPLMSGDDGAEWEDVVSSSAVLVLVPGNDKLVSHL